MFKFDEIILTALFFSLLPHILINASAEFKNSYYERNKNFFCANEKTGCSFNISSAYPYSPKIPVNIIHKGPIFETYRYHFYLHVNWTRINLSKFFLMAYDVSNEETIISNGDYYLIKAGSLINIQLYQFQIFKEIKNIRFIQLLFLGMPLNGEYQIDIIFESGFNNYFSSSSLHDGNSLLSNNSEVMLQLLKDFKTKYLEAIERTEKLKTVIRDIVKQLFDYTISLENKFISHSKTIPIGPYFKLTISYSESIEISASKFFKPEEFILSETGIVQGKINYHQDGFELLSQLENIKDQNTRKVIESFNLKMENVFIELTILDYESISVTVSTNALLNCFVITISFSPFSEVELLNLMNESIELKIEFTNKLLEELAKSTQPIKATEKNKSFLEENQKIILNGMICFLALGSLMGILALTGGAAAAPAVGTATTLAGTFSLALS